MITNIHVRNVQRSRSGHTRMAKLTFEDLTGSAPAMLWPEEFAKMASLVKNDLIGFIKATLDRRRDPPELIVTRIIPLAQGPAELTRGVVVRLQKGLHQTEHLERLLRAVRIRPGNLDLYLEIVGLEQVRRAVYKAGASLRVRFDEGLLTDLEGAVGHGHVRLLGLRGTTAQVDAGTLAIASPPIRAATIPAPSASLDAELDDTTSEESDDF
jgi:DNA polymerase-3 subunit alpha